MRIQCVKAAWRWQNRSYYKQESSVRRQKHSQWLTCWWLGKGFMAYGGTEQAEGHGLGQVLAGQFEHARRRISFGHGGKSGGSATHPAPATRHHMWNQITMIFCIFLFNIHHTHCEDVIADICEEGKKKRAVGGKKTNFYKIAEVPNNPPGCATVHGKH